MNLLAEYAYLAVCAFGAVMITRRLLAGAQAGSDSSIPAILIWVLICFALFQGGFHVLGYLDLSGQRRLVRPLNLLAVVVSVLILFKWLTRKSSAPRALVGIGFEWRLWRDSPMLVATAVGLLLVALLMQFQFPQGFEAHGYHLPVGVYIFQSSSLAVWDRYWGHVLPAAASLYFGFLLQILPERMVSSANAVFAIPLAVATYATARQLGADKRASALAVSGLLTIPLAAFSLFESAADIGAITFLAIAVYMTLVRPAGAIPSAMLAGLAAGLAYSFKLMHVVSIGYLFLVIASGCLGRRNEHEPATGLRANLLGASCFALGAFVTGGFWLVRSYWLFDNPFYPATMPVISSLFQWTPGPDIAQGFMHQILYVQSSWEWLIYPWKEALGWGNFFAMSGFLGVFFTATIPVVCLLVPAKLLLGSATDKRSLAVLWIGGALIFAAWFLTEREPRYFIGACVYLVPLIAWTISKCAGTHRKAYDAIVTTCVAVMLLVVVSRELLIFGDRIVLSRQFTRAQFYEYPEIIDHLPADSKIGLIGSRAWHYPLFGAGLRNRVASYPIVMLVLGIVRDEHDTEPMMTFKVPAAIELSYANLKRLQVTHLYVTENTELRPGPCVSLEEIGRMDRNPMSNHPLPAPRRVIKVTLCPEGGVASGGR